MLSGFFLHIIAWGMAKGKVTAYHITNKTTAHHEGHEEHEGVLINKATAYHITNKTTVHHEEHEGHEERIRIIFRFKKQRA